MTSLPTKCRRCGEFFPTRRSHRAHLCKKHPWNKPLTPQPHDRRVNLVAWCGSDASRAEQIDGWPADAAVYQGERLETAPCPSDPGRWDLLAIMVRLRIAGPVPKKVAQRLQTEWHLGASPLSSDTQVGADAAALDAMTREAQGRPEEPLKRLWI